MPSFLGKNRKKLKAKENEEDKELFKEMGWKPKEEKADEDIKKPGTDADEPSNDGAEVGHISHPEEVRSEEGREEKDVGGFVELDSEQDQRDRERRVAEEANGNQRKELLNEWSMNILNCLDPEAKQNFLTASFDAQISDIGLYILGILNRMHKMGDYFEPDIEPEWEMGGIGYDQDLYCEYCKQKITSPQNLRQRFCSNRCSRNYKLQNTTGVIFPKTEAQQHDSVDLEEKQWEAEQKRLGAMS